MTHPRYVAVRDRGFWAPFLLAKSERRASGAEHGRTDDRRPNGDPGARRSGGRARLRLSGRSGAADLRRTVPAGQASPHPGAPRAGRGACGGGLCALDRQGRVRAGHLGPGRTDALMDSTPLVCITGQVPTHLIGNDAFQECDTVGITRPCTKHNYLVKNVDDLARVLHEAFYVAANGRPGPVVVDIPKDVQFAKGFYS